MFVVVMCPLVSEFGIMQYTDKEVPVRNVIYYKAQIASWQLAGEVKSDRLNSVVGLGGWY